LKVENHESKVYVPISSLIYEMPPTSSTSTLHYKFDEIYLSFPLISGFPLFHTACNFNDGLKMTIHTDTNLLYKNLVQNQSIKPRGPLLKSLTWLQSSLLSLPQCQHLFHSNCWIQLFQNISWKLATRVKILTEIHLLHQYKLLFLLYLFSVIKGLLFNKYIYSETRL